MAGQLISLAHLSLLECTLPELVHVAAGAGFTGVGLRLTAPPGSDERHAIEDRPLLDETERRLRDFGLKVLDVEAIWLDDRPGLVDFYERLFDAAAKLGAANAVAMVHDTDLDRAVDTFSALCARAEPYGVSVNLEFAAYSAVKSISEANGYIQRVAQLNSAVLVDLLHFKRSGGTADDLVAYCQSLAPYIQFCDASGEPPPDVSMFRDEARFDRRFPGEGALPLRDLLTVLPDDCPLSVEAPCRAYLGLTPTERARRLLAATRTVLSES